MALDLGLEYRAPGIRLTPPPAERIDTDVPVLAVIGTGKRTGKTALGTHLAALLRDAGRAPVVVSMGRGGPPQPELVRADALPGVADLIEIVRGGATRCLGLPRGRGPGPCHHGWVPALRRGSGR